MIRFRVWDREAKAMRPVVELMWTPETEQDGVSGFVVASTDPAGPQVKTWPFGSGEIVLMESTGLVDKHGREIFEGDIMTVTSPLDPSRWVVMTMEWHKGCFCFRPAGSGNKDLMCPASIVYRNAEARYYEVIGNIYENPELLTGCGVVRGDGE